MLRQVDVLGVLRKVRKLYKENKAGKKISTVQNQRSCISQWMCIETKNYFGHYQVKQKCPDLYSQLGINKISFEACNFFNIIQ